MTDWLGKKFLVHRLIWALHNKDVPDLIDHKDRNKLNNKIENLRISDKSKNSFNSGIRSDNTSGYTGISYCKRTRKWEVWMTIRGERKWGGRHSKIERAIEARNSLEEN
jgi:hypothetical protein